MALRALVITVLLIASLVVLQPSYAAGFNLTELKAYYIFDETNGDLINEATNAGSVNSLGTSADGQLEAGVLQGQIGLIGNSYLLPGTTNGQIELGTSKSQFRFLHDSSTMKWSTNIWLKTTQTSSLQGLFSTSGCSTSDVGLDILYDGRTVSEKLIITLPQGALFQPNVVALFSQNGILAADGQWHMITVTHDHNLVSDNMKLYVDGVFIEAATKSGVTPVNSDHTETGKIGACADSTSGFPLTGSLDEFSIWNRILSTFEISDLYNNGAGLSFIGNSLVGGEIIPIDATSLFLAGMQTNLSILTVLVAVGSGAFGTLYYTTKRKNKSENS